jgi:hypothetical protein
MKGEDYIYSRDSNDPIIKAFYMKYCKILNKVIQEAKKQHNNRLIAKSDNKIKTTWNIIKQETRKILVTEQIPSLLTNEKMKAPEKVADVFNSFFLSIAENLNSHKVRNFFFKTFISLQIPWYYNCPNL